MLHGKRGGAIWRIAAIGLTLAFNAARLHAGPSTSHVDEKSDENRTAEYQWRLPPGFPPPAVPADNPMSAAKVALGCRLFFDTRLSSTGTYSCASCHRPDLAFTDGRARSIGATGQLTSRGSMSLANVAYNAAYTWASDRSTTLEQQMETPLFNTHPVEMGLADHQDTLLQSLRRSDVDAREFRAAFPAAADPVSMPHVIQAIAAFERTLLSGRSAFDRYVFDDDRDALPASARRGMALFFSSRSGCSECHSGLNFSGPIRHRASGASAGIFANTGIHAAGTTDLVDRGLIDVTGRAADLGKFRVPTLRNVALSAPYMHDGSIATLAAVIEHYVSVGAARVQNPELDSRLAPLALDNTERADLVSFLQSLTDTGFASAANLPCR